jgi:hypothetical protein
MINGSGPYQSGISDLQVLLSDQPDDRYMYRKRVFGQCDGTNTSFKTFDRRRVTNFTVAATSGEGLYLNSVLIASSNVTSDVPETGEFVLSTGSTPNDGDILEASYYFQWFDISELDTFLQISSRWLQGFNDYTQTPNQLIDALLKYAAAEAYMKMAQRWRSYMSQEYKVEDAPKDSPTYNTNDFLQLAKNFRAEALASRTEYMQTRQGRALQPLFGSIRGRVRSLGTGSDN